MGEITHYTEFCGVGGESEGADQVPDVETIAGANHAKDATDSFSMNFPKAQVFQEDITKLPIDKMPWAHFFTGSPACPAWTTANGMTRDFDKANAEPKLFVDLAKRETPKQRKRREEYRRSRLLMREIVRYLRAWFERGRIVPIGFLENVIQVRLWHEWDAYVAEFRKMGYKVRLIAFNSMHANPRRTKRVGQSRNRAYLAYWHESIGRDPDWDKWLRPRAYCRNCGQIVEAVQVFKDPTMDMGAYKTQWVYRCPVVTCRREVQPPVVPAIDEIDLTLPAVRLADRPAHRLAPLVPATMRRMATGVLRYWLPLLAQARQADPLLVPTGGTWRSGRNGEGARSTAEPMATRTTRECEGIALPPFIAPLRGGGDTDRARPVDEPLTTVTASGNHHGLVLPPMVMRNQTERAGETRCTPTSEPMRTITASSKQALVGADANLLVPYYGSADAAQQITEPMGTLTTRDRYAVATVGDMRDDFALWEQELATASDDRLYELLANVWFRMLQPAEVGRAMGFPDDYKLAPKAKDRRVRLYGNAVTPCVSEIITCALVECLTGVSLETGWDLHPVSPWAFV